MARNFCAPYLQAVMKMEIVEPEKKNICLDRQQLTQLY